MGLQDLQISRKKMSVISSDLMEHCTMQNFIVLKEVLEDFLVFFLLLTAAEYLCMLERYDFAEGTF